MVSSVEDAIMDDKRRGHHGVTPKELLVKSNPGLYAEVTSNPRHMHNMLSSRKWAEDSKDDSHVKHVSSLLVPGPSFPFMSRTSSMNNINNFGGKMLRKHHSQSNQDLSAIDRRDKYSGVHRSLNISMEDLRKAAEADKENKKSIHFPVIRKERIKVTIPSGSHDSESSALTFPNVRSDLSWPLQNGSHGEVRVNHSSRETSQSNAKQFSHKLEKWFSEIPGEEYEKADQVLMDNMDNSKSLQREKSRHSPPRPNWRVPALKPMQSIPNQFLELRNELNTNGTINKETNINREQYKLRQKSLLQLKMLATEERDRLPHRTTAEFDQESRQYTFHTDRVPQNGYYHRQTLDDLARAKKISRDGVNKVDIGEFAIDAYSMKPNSKFTFACLGSSALHSTTNGHSNDASISSNDSEIQKTSGASDATKKSVVNLEVSRSRGALSDPKHSRKMEIFKRVGNMDDISSVRGWTGTGTGSSTTRSADSYSVSGNGFCRTKSVFSKFNTLEIFGSDTKSNDNPEQGHNTDSTIKPEEFVGSKKRKRVPVYKLDLKTTPKKPNDVKSEQVHHVKRFTDDIVQEIPTLSFEFQTGEVVVHRKVGTELNLSLRNKAFKRDITQKSKTASIVIDIPSEYTEGAVGSTGIQNIPEVSSNGTGTVTPDSTGNTVYGQFYHSKAVHTKPEMDEEQKPEVKDEGSIKVDEEHNDAPNDTENEAIEKMAGKADGRHKKEASEGLTSETIVHTSAKSSEKQTVESREQLPTDNSNEQTVENPEQETVADIDVGDTSTHTVNQEADDKDEEHKKLVEGTSDSTSVEPVVTTGDITLGTEDTPLDTGDTTLDTCEKSLDTEDKPLDNEHTPLDTVDTSGVDSGQTTLDSGNISLDIPVGDTSVDTGSTPPDTGVTPVDTADTPVDTDSIPVNTGDIHETAGDVPMYTMDTPVDNGHTSIDTGEIPLDNKDTLGESVNNGDTPVDSHQTADGEGDNIPEVVKDQIEEESNSSLADRNNAQSSCV